MAHEIREHDEQHGRSQAWHGLTKINPALSLGDADFYLKRWNSAMVGIRAFDPATNKFIALTGPDGEKQKWESLVVMPSETDTLTSPLFLSPPFTETYTPLDNVRFLAIIEKSLTAAGLPFDVESVGSVFNRRRVFVSIPLPGMETFKAGEREFKGFLNFINSHDQSTPFMANTSNTCTVCNNTLQMNLSTGGCLVKHTKNMADRLESLPSVISEAMTMQEAFRNDFLKLHSEAIEKDTARGLFTAFVMNGEVLSTRSFNIAQRLLALFQDGAGNSGKTFADVFSAITDFYTHESSGGDSEGKQLKQFTSSEFGDGARTKRQAMSYLMTLADNKDALKAEVEKGNQAETAYHAS